MRGVRVDLDAKVRTRDGESAGSVQQAIVDPAANEISHFVVSTGGLFGYDVLVPRERLEGSAREGDEIRLDLTRDELKNLPRYEPVDYTVPATGWVAPLGYGAYPGSAFLWPTGYVPTQPGQRLGDEGDRLPMIEKGAVVRDQCGDEIGVVDDIRLDPGTGQLQGVVIRAGGALQTLVGGGKSREIGMAEIERVGEGTVYLRTAGE
jgi:sporulation protein YlmC with PRC-barrel domain